MAESAMRKKVVQLLRSLNAFAVENPALPGTPDVNYVEGWLELKWLRVWPVNASTVVALPHYTAQQRVWHINRRRAGGRSWLLLQCKREWLLLDGAVAALHLGTSTKAQLIQLATKYWSKGIDGEELIACVLQTQSAFSLTEEGVEKLKQTLPHATA